MAKKRRSAPRLSRVIYYSLIVILSLVLLVSLILLGKYFWESRQGQQENNALASIRNQHLATATNPPLTTPAPSTGSSSSAPDPSQSTRPTEPPVPTEPTILPEYQPIYEMNSDLVGWIQIPGTPIDYPVLQTGMDNRDFYLNHKFDKTFSSWGAIYARELCDINKPSDNITLYGHHMQDGSMFAGLDKYKKESFWQDHQTFTFDTLYERHTYQVFAAFKTSASQEEGFRYHQMVDADSQEAFDAFIATGKSLSFYDTGITPKYGNKILCLSTCEYTLNNGRFVVMAMRIF